MSDHVPESPTSVASTHPAWDSLDWPDDWSDGIPLEVDEDVLVPYWENLHKDLFLDEAVLRVHLRAAGTRPLELPGTRITRYLPSRPSHRNGIEQE